MGPARLIRAVPDARVGGMCFVYVVTTHRGPQIVRAWRTANAIHVETAPGVDESAASEDLPPKP